MAAFEPVLTRNAAVTGPPADCSAMPTLVLLRHGESDWNKKNLFTGWVDVDLSDDGVDEARRGGSLLAEQELLPQVAHTSLLTRAIRTSTLALEECGAQLLVLGLLLFEERRDLYNLYPLLVHVRLFGGPYVQQVENVLARYGC